MPGISTFYEDGGHATITLLAKNLEKDSDVVEIFDKGNGLQFIKVGAEVIRLSKAIEKGNFCVYITTLLYNLIFISFAHNTPLIELYQFIIYM